MDDLDDFHLSLNGAEDAADYFRSYKKAIVNFDTIRKLERNGNVDIAFFRYFKEVHQSLTKNQALFRRSASASETLSLHWLARCKQVASLYLSTNEIPSFRGLTKDQAVEIAKLSADPKQLTSVAEYLLQLGIILLYETSIPGMKLDGAVFKLQTFNPIVVLSLRYPRLDIFWFTLMHELGHIALHYDQLENPILDDFEEHTEDLVEMQANKFAGDVLISRAQWRSCKALYDQTDKAVTSFAADVGIHPAIVAGRIRRELNRHDLFSKIINEINVREHLA
jgi:HTH-type transcriptional regulator/antitoxin HigA